jgi:prepilin-type N-terminal cleavage/methylation domain-containing protein
MNEFLKSGKSGFTLVEVLMVNVIIGILAGMTMLTIGSATDSAESAKLLNDLRLVKAASLVYYMDEGEWPECSTGGSGFLAGSTPAPMPAGASRSIERYLDRPFSASGYAGGILVAVDTAAGSSRVYYGLSPDRISPGVAAKLRKSGVIYGWNGEPISYDGQKAFVIIH